MATNEKIVKKKRSERQTKKLNEIPNDKVLSN